MKEREYQNHLIQKLRKQHEISTDCSRKNYLSLDLK